MFPSLLIEEFIIKNLSYFCIYLIVNLGLSVFQNQFLEETMKFGNRVLVENWLSMYE